MQSPRAAVRAKLEASGCGSNRDDISIYWPACSGSQNIEKSRSSSPVMMVLLRSLRRRRLRDRRTADAPTSAPAHFSVAMETRALCVRLLADSGGIEDSLIYARHKMADG